MHLTIQECNIDEHMFYVLKIQGSVPVVAHATSSGSLAAGLALKEASALVQGADSADELTVAFDMALCIIAGKNTAGPWSVVLVAPGVSMPPVAADPIKRWHRTIQETREVVRQCADLNKDICALVAKLLTVSASSPRTTSPVPAPLPPSPPPRGTASLEPAWFGTLAPPQTTYSSGCRL